MSLWHCSRPAITVRGSVRDPDKADKVRATLAKAGGDISRLEIVTLDLMATMAGREAMDGCRYLQHTASPFCRCERPPTRWR